MATIKSINLTDAFRAGSLRRMEKNEASELHTSGEPSTHECECPEPCNCDHENE
jgi:hypothetical protein